MNRWESIRHRWKVKWIKWSKLEYLPFAIIIIPSFCYWVYFSLRSRSFLFFSNVNPNMDTGGMFGSSKSKVIEMIPQKYRPQSFYLNGKDQSLEKVQNMEFPLIVKPDVGERGFLVTIVNNEKELESVISQNAINWVVQEFIDYPEEFSVLYFRYPGEHKGKVSSICHKVPLVVTGDGTSSLKELILARDRSRLQYDRLLSEGDFDFNQVLEKDEKLILEKVGNHSRGSTFFNRNDLIGEKIVDLFQSITDEIDELNFCRYDLKCASIEDLKTGNNLRIVEINGVAAEPAHIYDPDNNIISFLKDFYYHWKTIYKISKIQKKRGFEMMPLGEAWKKYKEYSKYYKDNRN